MDTVLSSEGAPAEVQVLKGKLRELVRYASSSRLKTHTGCSEIEVKELDVNFRPGKIYTRLYMKDAVAALLWEHDHHEIPEVSMVIFDIDHFKKVNVTYGHNNGDVVLSQVAGVILRQSQEPAIPIRFGGEEFVVFMPAECGAAFELAERVRREIEAMEFDLGDTVIRATISGGVTAHQQGEALDEFMNRADQLLYKAKENGRNQTMVERRSPRVRKGDC